MKKKILVTIMSTVIAFSGIIGCSNSSSETANTETSTDGSTEETSVETDTESADEDESSSSESTEAMDENAEESEESDGESEEFAGEGNVIVDRSGNEITLPSEVNSIISMAPSVTRVLLDIGLADKIVACDTYSFGSYGDELNSDIPQFDMMTPDQEQIIALGADVIFTTGMSMSGGTDVYESVRKSGACITDIPSSASLQDIEDDIDFIGTVVGETEKTDVIVSEMDSVIKEIKEIGDTISDDEKKSVLFELYTPSADNPEIYTAGNGTYINEMIEVIGATNVASSESEAWPALSEEAAIGMNPDCIITADMYTEDVVNVILGTEGWSNVNAIVNNEVYQLNSDEINQPNHHVIDAMKEMAEAIYPDKYSFTDAEDSADEDKVDDAA